MDCGIGQMEMCIRDRDYPPGHVEGFPDTFKMFFRSVYGRIASGGKGAPLHATAEDGHREVAVCEAIMKSNERHAWVDVA